jgi:hypothetical protein
VVLSVVVVAKLVVAVVEVTRFLTVTSLRLVALR